MMRISKSKLIGATITCLSALFVLCAAIQVLKLRGTFAPMRSPGEAGGTEIQLGAPGHKVSGRVYISGESRPGAPLVVVLHGDAPNRKPSYQYIFATGVAAAASGVRVVGRAMQIHSEADRMETVGGSLREKTIHRPSFAT
jgi:hypothetical protein